MNVVKIPTALQVLREIASERGISPLMIKRAQLRFLTKEEARAASGFDWLSGPAIQIPYFDSTGARTDYERFKLLGDSALRYVAREKAGSRVYFPPGIEAAIFAAPSKPLYIIEGELKTLSAVDNLGIDAIGLSGVYNFLGRRALGERATPLPDLDRIGWTDRHVTVCFDSDWATNIEVRHALLVLGIELTARGAKVEVLTLPTLDGKKTGLDDWIVHCKRRKVPLRKAFDTLPRKTFDAADYFVGLSEVHDAARLRAHFGDHLRFVPETRKWLVLDDCTRTWKEDKTGYAMRAAKQLPTILLREAQHIRSDERRKAYLIAVANAGNKRRLDAALSLLESEAGMALLLEQFDRNPMLLALPGGTALDLREGVERPLRAEDYVTKVAGTVLGTDAECPTFIKFLEQICMRDSDYIAYVQRVMGYCLSGDTSEQCFFIQYGVGANGKSTLLSVLRLVLGDYAVQAGPETFMVQHGQGTRGDLVRLRGARVVTTSELEDGQRLAESVIKQWTGSDPIVARQLYCEPVHFIPTSKIFLATNHKPKVRGTDVAIWRRIQLWPFDLRLPKHEQDSRILEKLKAELPAILRWMHEGFKSWKRVGLNPPQKVTAATAAYRTDSDALGAWIKDCCTEDPAKEALGPKLYVSYSRYTAERHEFIHNQRDFYRLLSERGFDSRDTTKRKTNEKGKFFSGILLDDSAGTGSPVRKFVGLPQSDAKAVRGDGTTAPKHAKKTTKRSGGSK